MSKTDTALRGALGGRLFFITTIILLIAFVVLFANYKKAQKELGYFNDPETREAVDKKEADEIVEKVKNLIILPAEGEPMVATVKDVEALAEAQPFFAGAQNGDKVLIYDDKAIIYRVEENILVNVGPVYSSGNAEGEVIDSPEDLEIQVEEVSVIEPLLIDIRNGSTTAGVASEMAGNFTDKTRYEVINIMDAVNKDYEGTMVINVTNRDISSVEKALNVQSVSTFPEGEIGSKADVVIIIGE